MDQSLTEKIKALWNVTSKVVDDGTKYGSINPNDWVKNDLLGLCKVREIMDLENRGAIIFQDEWRIKTELKSHEDKQGPRLSRVPTEAWYAYQKRDGFNLKGTPYHYDYDENKMNL